MNVAAYSYIVWRVLYIAEVVLRKVIDIHWVLKNSWTKVRKNFFVQHSLEIRKIQDFSSKMYTKQGKQNPNTTQLLSLYNLYAHIRELA